jgi:hypothetical protein
VADSIGFGGANLAVFAPDIGHASIRLYALIRDDNGRVIIWKYPCIEQWSLTQRIFNDRYRKYSEIFRLSKQIYREQIGLWIDLACFAARSCNSNQYHPASVVIGQDVQEILLPGYKRVTRPNEDKLLFSYSLDPGDL